jgi:hypothetical protein
MQILVSDANVLIDIEHGVLLSSMFSMETVFVVPDVLFEKELRARHSHLLDLGLKVKTLPMKQSTLQKSLLISIAVPAEWIFLP